MSVVTIDDMPAFRTAVKDVIEATREFEAVGEADSGEAGIELVDALDPQLVLVDVRMPGMDGIEAARRIKARHPSAVVVLISADEATQLPSAIAGSGAAAYVRKQDFSPSMLRGLWDVHSPPGARRSLG